MMDNTVAFETALSALKKSASKAYAEFKKFDRAIKALQNTCVHDWKYTGHGHNTSYYNCNICGKDKEE